MATPLPPDARLRPAGSAWARRVLAWFGWQLRFEGLAAPQGVLMVYPHTSNWDFVIGVLAKWSLGLEARFWGKDSLFRLPLIGAWMRWIGGIPVVRGSAQGLVEQTVREVQAAAARGEPFWLAVAPEGTRALASGWRSGAYHVAVQAGIPVGLAYFDFQRRVIDFTHFYRLSGDPAADFPVLATVFEGVQGKRPELASPIRLRP